MAEISVIVPVYKVENYLSRCVFSILTQTFTDFELVLVDDGSPDRCGEMCDEYAKTDSRIVVIHQKNGGLSAARNAGIDWAFKNSDSKWITFIDSDDWVHAQYLEKLYEAAVKTRTEISMTWLYTTKGEVPTNDIIEYTTISTSDAYTCYGRWTAAYSCGKLFLRELFAGERFPVGILWEDLNFTHRVLFKIDQVAILSQPIYYYYTNPDGISNRKWSRHNLDQINAYSDVLLKFFRNRDKLIYDLQRKEYIKGIFGLIQWAIEEKDRKVADILIRRLRREMIQYNAISIFSVSDNAWMYETAFPKIMKVYWICSSIKHKLVK